MGSTRKPHRPKIAAVKGFLPVEPKDGVEKAEIEWLSIAGEGTYHSNKSRPMAPLGMWHVWPVRP